jgi:starch-binding outer membrane protein, SusD/RagB family
MKKFKLYMLLGLVTLLFSRCDKFLDVQPESGLTYENYWKTKEEVNAVVLACYQSMMTGSSSTYQVVDLAFLWGELRADFIAANTKISAEEYLAMNGYITENLSICDWTAFYRTINLCNTVIACAPNVINKDATFTQTALDGYLSEAYALRALMYFYLVRTFGEVPLKLDATLTDNTNLTIAKSSANVVLSQIKSDLLVAESKSVTDYGTTLENKGRITQYAINAMQADVYLWCEQYDSCIVACNKVINSSQYGLISDYKELFQNGLTNESIFELVFDDQLLNPLFYMVDISTNKRFLIDQRVIDDKYTTDSNNPDDYDLRGNFASVRFGNMSIWKYLGLTSSTARSESQSYAPWIFYRYADVLLMKAEAAAVEGDTAIALSIVRKIRSRGGALQTSAEEPGDATSALEYVIHERGREFAFEGKRWFDVLRTAKRAGYSTSLNNSLIEMIEDIAPTDRYATMVSNIQDTLSHYLPIYKDELETDEALEQNTFYKTN